MSPRRLYAGVMKRWWGFGVFVVVASVHLVALFVHANSVAVPTKALLMPALLLAFVVALPSWRTEITLWGSLALLLAWSGDVFLGAPGEVGFLVGLGSFLLAHVMYLLLYVRPLRTRRIPWYALIFGVWWVALVVLLVPFVGDLAIPVAIYGLVLCSAAAVAMGTTWLVALGAVTFLVSDTILAFKMFHPDFALWQADFVIMFFYIGGQALIILGTVRFAQSRVAVASTSA